MPDIDRICYGCVGDLDAPGGVCPRCGWDNAVRCDDWGHLPATTLRDGRFFVGRALGAGGFGVTYLGRDLLAGGLEDTRRAIKEFFPMGVAIRKGDGVSVAPAGSEMVKVYERRRQHSFREGQRMAGVSASINNVVRAYDCFPENGTTYIVMEYIEGDTLTKLVERDGPMAWRDVYTRLLPALSALGRMHDRGIYHLDISPDNIMLRRQDGEPVILDFGASIEAGAPDVTRTKSTISVRDGFTPPEQYGGNVTDLLGTSVDGARMDEYAICATMYYLLTGEVPVNSMARLAGAKLRPIAALSRGVPRHMESAIVKGMAMRASDRYPGMDALIRALRPRPVPVPIPRIMRPLLLAALAALAAGAVWWLMSGQPRPYRLNGDGSFTWRRGGGVQSGVLTGRSGDLEIRYALEDGQTIQLPDGLIERYGWTVEETGANGQVRAVAVQPAKEGRG